MRPQAGARAKAFLKTVARDRLIAASDRYAALVGQVLQPPDAARRAVTLGFVHR